MAVDTRSDSQALHGWDHSVDLLIVGSGAGAMATAICAHDRGGKPLIIEKTHLYGGSSAMSGGSLWVPNNHLMAAAGVQDSPDEALTYLRHITGGVVADEKLQRYVATAPEMLRYLSERGHLRMQSMLTYTDYYPEAPGGKPGGRSVEPEHFDARVLGDDFDQLREPALQELVMGRMSMTATEAHHLLARHPGWVGLTSKIMSRYWLDFGGRVKGKRDRCLSLGNALVGMLRRTMLDRKIPLWLETAARELVVEDGRVVGLVAEQRGRTIRIRAEKGLVLAAGGFESNDAMRKKYLPNPTEASWTTANPGNTGDAIQMGLALGAGLDLMDDAWWGPTTVVPGEDRARMLVIEKGLPGSIFVNKRGQRFVNEASPYNDICKAMYANHSAESPCVPAYMIFDATYRKKYPCGPFFPGSQQPDWALPKRLKETRYLKKSDTLEGLAAELGIDAAGLKASVARMNASARNGKDSEFHRGESLFDRYYGDDKVQPNPCLAPLETAPYYALIVYAGDLGTKGGLTTDASARVVRDDGSVIPGLFAIGNCSASAMGRTYPGAGGTMGPAMTFGYILACETIGN
ncbi:MAG: FAD-binding protein [Candidatus Binatia bacterium]